MKGIFTGTKLHVCAHKVTSDAFRVNQLTAHVRKNKLCIKTSKKRQDVSTQQRHFEQEGLKR